ncbi:MAG: acyl carrier protein [Phycisphaerales bacterium]|nr:acyl carrier protein [Phycisphaerales bacterium]
MTKDVVKNIVLEIIAVVAPDEDLSDLRGDVRLRDQLDMDSMDFLDIVMELRKRYKVEVPKEDYPRLATLDGCVEYLQPRLAAVNVPV